MQGLIPRRLAAGKNKVYTWIKVIAVSEYIHMRHNVNDLVYHIVCPTKYRRIVIGEEVDRTMKQICEEIELRYDIEFLEVGSDLDHVHFLVQSIPKVSPSQLVKTIKSIIGKEIFARCPEVKKQLWGHEFWTDGYYIATVGKHTNEAVIAEYVKQQGSDNEYKQIAFNLR